MGPGAPRRDRAQEQLLRAQAERLERRHGGLALLHRERPGRPAPSEAAEPNTPRLRHRLNILRTLALVHQPRLPAPDHQPPQATELLRAQPREERKEEAGFALQTDGAHVRVLSVALRL